MRSRKSTVQSCKYYTVQFCEKYSYSNITVNRNYYGQQLASKLPVFDRKSYIVYLDRINKLFWSSPLLVISRPYLWTDRSQRYPNCLEISNQTADTSCVSAFVTFSLTFFLHSMRAVNLFQLQQFFFSLICPQCFTTVSDCNLCSKPCIISI